MTDIRTISYVSSSRHLQSHQISDSVLFVTQKEQIQTRILLKFALIRQPTTTFNPATNKIMKAKKILYTILLLFLQASRIDGFSPHVVQHSRIAAFGTSVSKNDVNIYVIILLRSSTEDE